MQPGLKKGVEKSLGSVWKSWAQRYSHPVPSLFLNTCFILVSWKIGFLCVSVHVIGARGCPQLPTHLCRRPARADVGSLSLSESLPTGQQIWFIEIELGIHHLSNTLWPRNQDGDVQTLRGSLLGMAGQFKRSLWMERSPLCLPDLAIKEVSTAQPLPSSSPQLRGDR